MAAKEDSISHIKARFICAICLNTYQSPKTFPCFHSYCCECIKNLQMKTLLDIPGYECPTCRKFAPEQEVKANFFVQDLAKLVHNLEGGSTVCTQCNAADPQWKCLDCKIQLCEKCQSGHLKIPVCRGHKVQPVAGGGNQTLKIILDEVVFCPKHPEEILKFHCTSCETPICIQCKVLEHDTHAAETIDHAVEKIVQKLKRWKDKIDKDIVMKCWKKDYFEKEYVQVEKQCDKMRKRVQEHEKKVIENAKKDAEALLEELYAKEFQQRKILLKWQDASENELKKQRGERDYLSIMLDMSQGVSLMQAFYSGLHLHYSDTNDEVCTSQETDECKWESPILCKSDTETVQSLAPYISYEDKVVHLLSETKENMAAVSSAATDEPQFQISTFFAQRPAVIQTIDLSKRIQTPRRFTVINSEIFVVLQGADKITILTLQGTHKMDITIFRNPTAVTCEEGNNIIVSSTKALHLYDTVHLTECSIHGGNFADVCYENEHVVALTSSPHKVLVFQRKKAKQYLISRELKYSGMDIPRVLLQSGYLYIHSVDKHQVIVCNLEGQQLRKITTEYPQYKPNKAAKLCLVDSEENLIFSDWYNSLLEIHIKKESKGSRSVSLGRFENMTVVNDVLPLKDTLFVLAGKKIHKLKKVV